ncbi:MAG: lipid-A-disaccharide synthase [Pseudomonadales bacterium]|nr:lipid-A-disaccharide synthase [Pseudomonadales bacterium]
MSHYVLVAGEPSGDALGADLITAIRAEQPNAKFSGVGGQLMQAAGLDAWFDIETLSVNGFVGPLLKLPTLISLLLQLRHRCLRLQPAAFIGVDFNFFNLLLAGLLKRAQIPTVHYVSPSVWAWRKGRIHSIKRRVDLMLTLYPFETEIYEQFGIPVRFVGHPKAQLIENDDRWARNANARTALAIAPQEQVIALLPGSRRSEVASMMPAYLEAAKQLLLTRSVRFLAAAANPARAQEIRDLIQASGATDFIQVEVGNALTVMAASDAVMVNSGTATLEAMLLRKPMVMAYRLGPMTYWLVSRMVGARHFALPNILAGEALVEELIQDEVTGPNLATALERLLDHPEPIKLQVAFDVIHESLKGDLRLQAAQPIIALAASRQSL